MADCSLRDLALFIGPVAATGLQPAAAVLQESMACSITEG
jgi:hypothetical protein